MCVLCSSLTLSGEEGMGGEVWMQFGKGGGDAKGVVAWVSGRSRVGGRLRKRGGVMCVCLERRQLVPSGVGDCVLLKSKISPSTRASQSLPSYSAATPGTTRAPQLAYPPSSARAAMVGEACSLAGDTAPSSPPARLTAVASVPYS